MKNFIIYASLLLSLLATKLSAQETFEAKARAIADKIENITKEEKAALKADPPLGNVVRRRGEHLLEDVDDGLDLRIVQLNRLGQLLELRHEFARRGEEPAETDERPHDLDVHPHGGRRTQHAGEHRHALLGERTGRRSTAAVPRT